MLHYNNNNKRIHIVSLIIDTQHSKIRLLGRMIKTHPLKNLITSFSVKKEILLRHLNIGNIFNYWPQIMCTIF